MAYTGQAVFGGTTDPVTGSWSNATALNATIVSSDITGYGVVAASFVISGTITQGTAIFEVSDDAGTTWWPIAGLQTGNNNQASTFVLTGTSASYEFATGAYNLFRVRLNPVILGSGSVAIRLSAEAFPFLTAVAITGTTNVSITGTNAVTVSGTVAVTQSGTWNVTVNTPLPAGTNVIGHVITDSGSTTAVTGTVAVTQSTNPWVVSLTSTTITGTVAVTQSTSPWVTSDQNFVTQGSTTSGEKGVLMQGAVTTSPPSYTTAQTSPLSLDTSGNLRVVGSFSAGALPDLVGTPGTLNALNAVATINAFGYNSVGMQLAAGTLVGTIVAEASLDGGTTWVGTFFDDPTVGTITSSITFGSSNTATARAILGVGGASNYRVRVSAFTSGTASCTLRANEMSDPAQEATGVVGSGTLPPIVSMTGGIDFNNIVRRNATDFQGNQQIGFGGAGATSFGRGRTAQPYTVFASKFQYDTQPLLFQTSVSGTGTVAKTANESSLTLSTGGTASGATAILQSKQYFPYEPGKSQLMFMTGVMGAIKANVAQRIGYFDANDGVFFQQDGTNLSVVQRSSTSGSPVNTTITQANWNIDKLDGTGPSGFTINNAGSNIFVIDLQWLGVGRVRYGFDINGVIVYCHQINNANTGQTSPYMNTATLPIRWEITNTGTAASTTTLKAICGAVISEGGQELPGVLQFSATNGATTIGVTTRRPVLSVQVKTTFNSITNRETIIPGSLGIFNDQSLFYEVVFNGTLTGASFNSVNSQSGMNFDVAATAISGGIIVSSGYIGTAKSSASSLLSTNPILISAPFTLDFAGTTGDILTIVATSLSGTSNVGVAVDWIEVR
jgi:hypothetical protein